MKRMEPLKRNEQRKNDEVPYKNKNNGVNRSIRCYPPPLYPCCTLTVPLLYPHCTPAVPLLYPCCILTVPLLYPDCILTVPLLYPDCTPAVPSLYPCCTLTVPLLYPDCTPAVSSLYPHYIPIIIPFIFECMTLLLNVRLYVCLLMRWILVK